MLGSKIKNQKLKIKNANQNFPAKAGSRKIREKIFNFGLSFWILALIIHYPLSITHYQLFAQEEFKYDAKGKRNPFIPLVTSDGRLLKLDREELKGDLALEGIIYDKHGRSFAIVNGTVIGIGDRVGDYQVLKIEESKVVFIKEGQTIEVELKKEAQ